ncbi:hypothetical protein HY024_01045 [Candidatus Curtissbacteria bacterium]|nr:hypothetical protein [Candidatus Curtissbacteria bacterium]
MVKNKKAIGFAGLIFIVAAVFTVIQAQTVPPALIVHPSNLEFGLEPGKTQEGSLYVKNTTDKALSISTDLRNFSAEGEEGGVALTKENIPFSLASWIKITPEKAEIAPNQEVKFSYSVTPPTNAEAGGHFGSVVFGTVAPKNPGGAAVAQEIATLFLVRIPGKVTETANIESFEPDQNFYEFGPVKFNLRVKNTGGVHIKPAGVITLSDMLGHKTYIGFQGENVLPQAVRKMSAMGKDKWLIGKYTADLSLSYGTANSQLHAASKFYAFPVRVGIAVLVVLFMLFLLRRRLSRSLKILLTGKQ